jgi:hypothetical protein
MTAIEETLGDAIDTGNVSIIDVASGDGRSGEDPGETGGAKRRDRADAASRRRSRRPGRRSTWPIFRFVLLDVPILAGGDPRRSPWQERRPT